MVTPRGLAMNVQMPCEIATPQQYLLFTTVTLGALYAPNEILGQEAGTMMVYVRQ